MCARKGVRLPWRPDQLRPPHTHARTCILHVHLGIRPASRGRHSVDGCRGLRDASPNATELVPKNDELKQHDQTPADEWRSLKHDCPVVEECQPRGKIMPPSLKKKLQPLVKTWRPVAEECRRCGSRVIPEKPIPRKSDQPDDLQNDHSGNAIPDDIRCATLAGPRPSRTRRKTARD